MFSVNMLLSDKTRFIGDRVTEKHGILNRWTFDGSERRLRFRERIQSNCTHLLNPARVFASPPRRRCTQISGQFRRPRRHAYRVQCFALVFYLHGSDFDLPIGRWSYDGQIHARPARYRKSVSSRRPVRCDVFYCANRPCSYRVPAVNALTYPGTGRLARAVSRAGRRGLLLTPHGPSTISRTTTVCTNASARSEAATLVSSFCHAHARTSCTVRLMWRARGVRHSATHVFVHRLIYSRFKRTRVPSISLFVFKETVPGDPLSRK